MRGTKGKFSRSGMTFLVVVLVALAAGYLMGRHGAPEPAAAPGGGAAATTGGETAPEGTIWTCSMHPQIRHTEPGKCPICGMELIPLETVEGAPEPGAVPRIVLSEHARKLASVEVAPVERRFVETEVRMFGKVVYDETRVKVITAWFPGRLERLFVDYTGVSVEKGDHLFVIYSPELLTAQQELIQAEKALRRLRGSRVASVRDTAELTVAAAREKLRLWGLSQSQIDGIVKRGVPRDRMTIYAPISGIVIHKNGVEGMYVTTGTKIYTIADLSRLWVTLDAYESDLPWIRLGQRVQFEVEAYPGRSFEGRVTFIDPTLDPRTRTVKVRLNVDNSDGLLKPEMFVRAVLHAKFAADRRVVDSSLAGKWISPMHPEVVKDGPGTCDVCGMPLVRVETLGYAPAALDESSAPLVIPASAPLITGKRAIVYVATPETEGEYEGRVIRLGPRAGDYYIVESGLAEGERVVVKGNFKIDSAVQLQAKPSMMSPPEAPSEEGPEVEGAEAEAIRLDAPPKFREELDRLFSAYYLLQQALSEDSLDAARKAVGGVTAALEGVEMGLLDAEAHQAWMKELNGLSRILEALGKAGDLDALREQFALLSEALYAVAVRFPTTGEVPILRFHCPMAFDNRGADWLQPETKVRNPYFGGAMPGCGSLVETVAAPPSGDE